MVLCTQFTILDIAHMYLLNNQQILHIITLILLAIVFDVSQHKPCDTGPAPLTFSYKVTPATYILHLLHDGVDITYCACLSYPP